MPEGQKTTNFGWKIYFLCFILLSAGNAVAVFSPDAVVYTYYHVLMAFDPSYTLPFYLNAASAIFTLLSLVPLYLFTFHKRWGPAFVWQVLFLARLGFDVAGRSYEVNFFISLAHNEPSLAWTAAGLSLVILLPSYAGHFHYAFRRDKLFLS